MFLIHGPLGHEIESTLWIVIRKQLDYTEKNPRLNSSYVLFCSSALMKVVIDMDDHRELINQFL